VSASGVNRTATSPVTSRFPGSTASLTVYRGRSGQGSGYPAGTLQPPASGAGRIGADPPTVPPTALVEVAAAGGPVVASAVVGLVAGASLVVVDGAASGDRLVNLLSHPEAVLPLEGPAVDLKLEGYGYRWYRLHREGTTTTP